ncbi:MAG: hypothetical protein WDO71_15795 [Bacteroidota bacterium]
MIADTDSSFEKTMVADGQLKKYGFESLNEYNTFRYSDYCFKTFIEAAEKEDYFHIPFLFSSAIMAWREMRKRCILLPGQITGLQMSMCLCYFTHLTCWHRKKELKSFHR